MSARNYLSARDKKFECLPSITQKARGELPPLSANTAGYNRNLNYHYDAQGYMGDCVERAGTPFSDFFSESEIDTPDFRSEESDSSSGSALRRNNAEATRTLSEEWQRIERTLYDEEGEKCTRPQIIEECKQWKALHPQLRVVGRAVTLPEKRPMVRQGDYDELLAIHYSDYSEFSESDERLSQSSTDVTPENSPRVSVYNLQDQRAPRDKVVITENLFEPKLSREKMSKSYYDSDRGRELPDSFCSLLHINPLQIRSPSHRKRPNHLILKSEITSSRWMKNSRPDSSINCDRNSAKSFVSLDTRNYGNLVLSASDRKQSYNRGMTARYRDVARLEPLCTPDIPPSEMSRSNGMPHAYSIRKVSLPPLLLEEEKKKVTVNSAKKYVKSRKTVSKTSYGSEKTRRK